MKILLPVCGADDAKLIVDFAANYHWPPHACFRVLHVMGSCETEEQSAEAERNSTILLGHVVERLHALMAETPTTWEIASGDAIYEIVSQASQWQADMIVMGSRTREDIESFLAGSVAKGVVMQAPCSVVVIKPPRPPAEGSEAKALTASQA